MKEDKRIRINKRMMAWSNGERINVIPSVWCEVDDYGKTLIGYRRGLREGDAFLYPCTIVREECTCSGHQKDFQVAHIGLGAKSLFFFFPAGLS